MKKRKKGDKNQNGVIREILRCRRSYLFRGSITPPPLRFIRVIPLTIHTIHHRKLIVNTFLQYFLTLSKNNIHNTQKIIGSYIFNKKSVHFYQILNNYIWNKKESVSGLQQTLTQIFMFYNYALCHFTP